MIANCLPIILRNFQSQADVQFIEMKWKLSGSFLFQLFSGCIFDVILLHFHHFWISISFSPVQLSYHIIPMIGGHNMYIVHNTYGYENILEYIIANGVIAKWPRLRATNAWSAFVKSIIDIIVDGQRCIIVRDICLDQRFDIVLWKWMNVQDN